MRVTDNPINVFVFGDLVLDHAIFVKKKSVRAQKVGDEKVYDVIRRVDTAGGAANCARALAVLSRGRTFLWGVTGASPWGTFASVLRNAEVSDCAVSPIVFWTHYERAPAMNTITRVIREDGRQRHHEYRFDDVGHALNEDALATAAAYLHNAEGKYGGVHAIIINDLDMHALSSELVGRISDFASQRRIPIFVDPKRNVDKYKNMKATAILPNLDEWCSIIGEPFRVDEWREAMQSMEGLRRMADRSFQALPNFVFHVIKADKDGAVVIGPILHDAAVCNIVRLPPHAASGNEELPHQLGCGDVLAAVLALEYASSSKQASSLKEDNTERFLDAFQTANAVVAAYREMPWHRMPRREDIERLTQEPRPRENEFTTTAPSRFLPQAERVDLADLYTQVPGLLSTYPGFHDKVKDLLLFLREKWEGTELSAILTAEGGSGKSLLFKALPQILREDNIQVVDISENTDKCKTEESFQDLVNSAPGPSADMRGTVLMIDEAFKRVGGFLRGERGVLILERAHTKRKRFLFVDADFDAHTKDLSNSQFMGRCKVFRLPKLRERPNDIVPIFANGCLSQARSAGIEEVYISREVLLCIIHWVLAISKNPRDVHIAGDAAVKKALLNVTKAAASRVDISLHHLKDIHTPPWINAEGVIAFYCSDRGKK